MNTTERILDSACAGMTETAGQEKTWTGGNNPEQFLWTT